MRKKIRYYALVILALIFIGNLISFTLHPSLIHSPRIWLTNCLFSVAAGLPMMKLSEFIIRKSGSRIRWEVNPGKRIAATLGVVIVVAVIVTFLINYIFILNIQGESFSDYIKTTLNLLLLQIVIVVFAFSLITAIQFFKMWKEGLMKQEALQRRAIELQLEALKNQVNPHFLFNSLNTLTSLIPRDPDMAVKMVMHLSDSYRYLLEQLEQLTDPERFFRVNRKYIVSFEAINDIITYSGTRLKVKVKQSGDDDIFVSRDRMQPFKAWLNR